MTTVLITNDDGIQSPGLHALAEAAVAEGFVVVVAAPDTESSGSSASIIGAEPDGQIRMQRREIEGLELPCYAVRAAPALIALIAAHGAFGAVPDLVLSGINRGANIGHAILHSGTVGAALTGGANGARGLAISLDVGMNPKTHEWAAAAKITRRLLAGVVAAPPGTVLNLNVPNDARAGDLDPQPATLAPFGIVQTTAVAPAGEGDEGGVRLTVADLAGEHDPRSDAHLLAAGRPTLTAVSAVGEAPLPDSLR
ncbi:5'/3'-nucleotidase SurE [Agromyces sp. Marseille-P2726]|uniref:5'/3'-nucleotidase SurE n=1 Tax=Agromyces sp. Marseille-P2726 TaxID=2709132 RepID=UPI00156DD383|nr:5'/3'-nucleotidase SurE [Agromyces sp. Marseille-P2726]